MKKRFPLIEPSKQYQLSDLPKMTGKQYLIQGTSLMLLKYCIDSLVANYLFHRPWMFYSYFAPTLFSGAALTSADMWFYAGMLLIALPFAFIGCMLTLRRLNTIGLPPWMVILFYTPFVNMIFFIILSVVEAKPSTSLPESKILLSPELEKLSANANQPMAIEQSNLPVAQETDQKKLPAVEAPMFLTPGLPGEKIATKLISKMPSDNRKAFLLAAALPVPISVLAAMFSVTFLGTYGWSVFIAVPFVAAIAGPILYGWQKQRTLAECIFNSVICLLLMASILLIIPFEGIICLLMASPLAVGIGIVGGLVGYAIQASMPRNEGTPRLLGCFAILLPLLIVGEVIARVPFPTYENVSHIEIAAPPNIVWKYLIDFPRLKPPTELIFQTGIAYPIEAKINGRGPGAIRECIFTTGKFIEPIQIWDEPKLLKFGVLEQAPPMHELSFYPNLHPPHLDHYLVARQGQFLLTPSGVNHTTLYGTTWYQNCMGPGGYWRLWSDWIIHSIHMRVLNHVKNLAETEYKTTEKH